MTRLLMLIACFSLPFGTATTFQELELDDMISRAQIGFYGEVQETTVETRNGEPWTLVSFQVQTLLLGELENDNDDQDVITLAFFGGSSGGLAVTVSGMPDFQPGEEVLILAYDASYYSPIVGFSQALWRNTARGFEDDAGRILSLDDEDALQLDGDGGSSDDILEALRRRLEGGS